ncbi:MAG: hypothetical protein M1540_01940 [Candidatus Bathyarchaeota archaeon]|nr:hypothetical protein [Candidatus Bathyarchaeota archaeon]
MLEASQSETAKCPSEFKDIIFVRYLDHVAFNRSIALVMQPQVREAVGWLIYECDQFVTLAFDRDAMPPTLKGGDPKASGLVLLKSDIIELKKLSASLALKCVSYNKSTAEYAQITAKNSVSPIKRRTLS